jgi:hypothetical protein
MEETTVATIVLTVACGRTSHKDPVIQLRMRESVLRLAQFVDGQSDSHSLSILLDRLSGVLGAVGMDLRKRRGICKGALRLTGLEA